MSREIGVLSLDSDSNEQAIEEANERSRAEHVYTKPPSHFKRNSARSPGPPVYSKTIKPHRKCKTNPDLLAKGVVSPTDYKHILEMKRSCSLGRPKERPVSYPPSDDVTKDKALAIASSDDSDDSDQSARQHLDTSGNEPDQLSMAARMRDTLVSTHKSPDFDTRLQEFIKDAEAEHQWSKKEGFIADDDTVIMHFYQLVNLVIRSGGDSDLCLLCCQPKDTRDGGVDSHIFPKCLLDSYSKIHDASSALCIFDPSPPYVGMHSPKNFTLPLFCSKCDNSTSLKEGQLRNLYLYLMDPEFADKTIKVNRPAWLWYVSAAIMFRGMLLINFFELINNNAFKPFQKAFLEIRHYLLSLVAVTGVEKKEKMCSIPSCLVNDFGLYLLPVGSFQNPIPNVTTLFDFTLRNPQHTVLVRDSKNTFLCTNFDCFYFTLQLSVSKSISLKDSCLGKITDPFILLPPSSRRYDLFPSYLLHFKYRQTRFVQTISLKHSRSMTVHTKAVTERLPRCHSRPTFFMDASKTGLETAFPTEVEYSNTHVNENKEEMYQRAKQESPLAGSEQVKELVKEKKALEERVKEEQRRTAKIQSSEKNAKSLQQQLNTSKKKEKEHEKQIEQLQKKVATLENELKEMNRKILQGSAETDRSTSSTAVGSDVEEDVSSISLHHPNN